ncbi:hypothetical protein [Pectobacterium cacticida]|uniref:hypothetical protein n=1 Tax=Pectobacterium cacticida TaxID=69221 RepID=UPI003985D58E
MTNKKAASIGRLMLAGSQNGESPTKHWQVSGQRRVGCGMTHWRWPNRVGVKIA